MLSLFLRSPVFIIFFCILYLLPGLLGHDPWKTDDATHFGVVYSFLTSDHWLVPQLAGSPYLDNPPLYYWIAAAVGRIFGLLLPLEDAVRLTSGLCGAMLLLFLSCTVRLYSELVGVDWRGIMPVPIFIAIGCLGFLVHFHDTQPMTAALAANVAVYYGLLRLGNRPYRGGAIAGLGLGLSFLAGGLSAIVGMVLLILALPAVSAYWRSKNALIGLLVLWVCAMLIALWWPAMLAFNSPDALYLWWRQELLSVRWLDHPFKNVTPYIELLSWFAWPALPLAVWTLWQERRKLGQPYILLAGLACLLWAFVIVTTTSARSVNALPILPPLVLLAVPGALSLRRGAANAFNWFGIMTFTLFSGLVWLGWIAMISGWPSRLAERFVKLEPGFVAQFFGFNFTVALLLTLAWIVLVVKGSRNSASYALRSTLHWAAGLVLVWALFMTLWLPWIDYGKSYRAVTASLVKEMQTVSMDSGCIIGRSLGSAQRASFFYFGNIKTVNATKNHERECKFLLVQGNIHNKMVKPIGAWRKIWEGHRAGDRDERFWLYWRS